LKKYFEVVYFDRTSNISIAQLKQRLSGFSSINKEGIVKALELLKLLKQGLL
tara:strand:- start:5348 stop:5503 length:156 start_codon:yes stop_codon:yes gene_type:complete